MNKTNLIIIPLVVAVVLLLLPFVFYSGKIIMVVTSDSMLPTLKPYDLIIVEEVGIEEISEGDIIAFDSHIVGLGIIAHRAVEVFDENGEIGVDTQGDNVEERDRWVVHDQDLIGKVVDTVPNMGVFLIDPVRYGIVAIIIITAISLLHEVMSKPKKTTV